MTQHRFLSPEWLQAARAIRDEYKTNVAPPPVAFSVNVNVTEMPFGDPVFVGYIENTSGELVIEQGALANADLVITAPYQIARELFLERSEEGAMTAFMSGSIQIEGDLALFFGMGRGDTHPDAEEISERISAITSPQ